MTDDQALVELLRLTVMPGLGGREGHTGIFPGAGTHEFPILLWQFSDGLVITAARAPYEDLVGSRIETIAGRPVADVLALVEPLTPRDNPSNLLAYAPLYLRMSEVLSRAGRPGPGRAGDLRHRRSVRRGARCRDRADHRRGRHRLARR